MTTPTVTQRDREAAETARTGYLGVIPCDDYSLAHHFARHREQTLAEVVAYIRSIEREDGLPFGWADQLLSGEYQKHTEKPT